MAGDRTSAKEAATTLRALVAAIEAGELTAPALLVARLEVAIVALEALAVGRQPTAVDFLGPDALHDTVLHFPSETDLPRFQTRCRTTEDCLPCSPVARRLATRRS